MKKVIWIVVGLALVLGVGLLIRREIPLSECEKSVVDSDSVHSVVTQTEDVEGQRADDKKPLLSENADDIEPLESVQSSEAVQTIVGGGLDYRKCLMAMRELGYEIPPQDIAVLMEFLGALLSDDLEMPPIEYNSIRNDVIEILLEQKQLPDGLGQLLVDVYNNPEQGGMWRNYCLQFMEPFYEKQSLKVGGAGSDEGLSDTELNLVRETMWNALGERDNSNAGTALLGLDKLARNHPEIEWSQVTAAMADLVTDESASLANRITALRLCGERGHPGALDTARDLAQHGDVTMLRCAAIATLGDLGSNEDRVLLESYAASEDERIQRMARRALEKLGVE